MIKIKILLLISLCFTITFSRAQSYSLDSFEGDKVKIELYYEPGSGMLTISYGKDTILINNYLALESAEVVNRVFLKVNYVKRIGSNQDYMKQLWLCVYNGKLGQALHVESFRRYDMRNISNVKNQPSEYSLFKLGVRLTGSNIDKYKLTINVHSEKKTDNNPRVNYSYNKIKYLFFDKKNRVFYSNYENVVGYYTFSELNNQNNQKKYLKNNCPIVVIEKDKYYYINGNWYTLDKNNFYSVFL